MCYPYLHDSIIHYNHVKKLYPNALDYDMYTWLNELLEKIQTFHEKCKMYFKMPSSHLTTFFLNRGSGPPYSTNIIGQLNHIYDLIDSITIVPLDKFAVTISLDKGTSNLVHGKARISFKSLLTSFILKGQEQSPRMLKNFNPLLFKDRRKPPQATKNVFVINLKNRLLEMVNLHMNAS